jgi:hypothetical protein
MSSISKLTMTVFVPLCWHAYCQMPDALWADTQVNVRTMQTISPAMLKIGQDVDIQVMDTVWAGNTVVILRDANGIAKITAIHKFPSRPIQIEIGFMYVRAASGERVPLRSGQLLADWKVSLPHGVLPTGAETTAHVSRDMPINVLITTESTRPAGIDHAPVRWSVSR